MITSTVRAFSMALGLITAICGNAAPPAPVNPESSLKEATPASYGYAVQGRELVVVDRHSFAVAKRIALDERVNRVLAHPAGDSVFLLTETSVLRLNPYSWTIDGRIALSRSSAWAISADGNHLYVAGANESDTRLLSVIDTPSLSVRELALPSSAATAQIALASSAGRLYLANPAAGCCADSLTIVDSERLALIDHRQLPLEGPIAVDPDGHWLYLQSGQRVLVLDVASNEVIAEIALNQEDFGRTVAVEFLFDPDRQSAFIATAENGAGFGGIDGRILEVALGAGSVLRTIDIDLNPSALQLDRVRSRLYVTGQIEEIVPRPGQLRPGGIRAIDLATGQTIASIPPRSADPYAIPRGSLQLDPAADLLYARDGGGLYVLDLESLEVSATLPPVLDFALLQPAPATLGDSYHFVLASSDGRVTGGQWGGPGDLPLPADYSGDGRADLAVFRPREGGQQGLWYVRRSTDLNTIRVQWGSAEVADLPVPADYDGDGATDFAVWRPDEGEWFVIASASGASTGTRFGRLPGKPVPADYDGDGRADLALYDSGFWQIFASRDGAIDLRLGEGLELPVPGDYDGDGRTDLAVYSPLAGYWRILLSSSGDLRTRQWGGPGDVPVPADFDGDGKTDVAVWRPATGIWWIVESATSSIRSVQWGGAGDRPQPADYDGDGRADVAVFRP